MVLIFTATTLRVVARYLGGNSQRRNWRQYITRRWGYRMEGVLIVTAQDLGFRSYPRTQATKTFQDKLGRRRSRNGFRLFRRPKSACVRRKCDFVISQKVYSCTPSSSLRRSRYRDIDTRNGARIGLVRENTGGWAAGARSRKDLGYLMDSGSSRRRRSTN